MQPETKKVTVLSTGVVQAEEGSKINEAARREIVIRVQKNLILLKALADSTGKLGNASIQKLGKDNNEPLLGSKTLGEFEDLLGQVNASQEKVSTVFFPFAFQLYPELAETLKTYTEKITEICSGDQDLPVGLLNELEPPRVQSEFNDTLEGASHIKPIVKNLSAARYSESSSEDNAESTVLFSKEYHLFLASIYLSEAIEQMEKELWPEVREMARVIRPEVTDIENACSRIHNIFTRSLEEQDANRTSFLDDRTSNMVCEKCFEGFNSQGEYLIHLRGHYGPPSEVPAYYLKKDFPMGRDYVECKKTCWLSKNDLKHLLFESYGAM